MLYCFLLAAVFSLPTLPTNGGATERQKSFTAADYARVVADYMEGNFLEAARSLAGVPIDTQEAAIADFRERVILESHVKAALLLHTEVVMWTRRHEAFHLRQARTWMGELDAYQRRSFEKSWFLMLGYFHLMSLDPETQPTLEAASSVFPNDVDVLLALGTWKETAGWMKRDQILLEEAEAVYRGVLQADPRMPEAMVRMGRVLELLGRKEEALRYLEQGLNASQDPAIRFAAFLTGGDIRREKGELTKAIEGYRAAVDLDPWSQSAVVALSHAIHESGDTAGAYEIVHEFFVGKATDIWDRSRRREELDLWWSYLLGHSDRFDSLLGELRAAVQR